jgi:hypothetical protein
MAQVNKLDSNASGLRFAEELGAGIGLLSGSEVWVPLEPNSYDAFGGEITTVARNPINDSRQRLKGVTTDLDASGGFNMDLTQSNLQNLLQGFFFADLEPKGEEIVTSVTGGGVTNDYNVALTAGFLVDHLINATGFTDPANNGVKLVDGVTVDTLVSVVETLVNEASPPADAQITVIGFEAAAGDLDVTAGASFPTIDSTALDFTTLGLIPGEWIFVGGDAALNQFTNATNNGFMRVRSITANTLTIDKASGAMVTEASTTEEIRLFFGRVLRNQPLAANIIRRSYQLERTLGAPDDTFPAQIHAEYLEGAIANEITFNMNTADKITADLSFVAIDHTTIDGPTSLKAGTRPTLVSEDAFNTSSDFTQLRMNVVSATDEFPVALFAFLTDFTVAINNNVTPAKAVSVLGAFDVTAGQFNVEGSATAYFSNVSAIASIRNNSDVTMHWAVAKGAAGAKSGVVTDIPLIALGDGRLNVEQDAPITIPLTTAAAKDPVFAHTLLMTFFDFLPDLADT